MEPITITLTTTQAIVSGLLVCVGWWRVQFTLLDWVFPVRKD